MGKWLSKFSANTPENGTDKASTVAIGPQCAGSDGSIPRGSAGKIPPRTLRNGTCTPSTLPPAPSVLGMSVPLSKVQPGKSSLPVAEGPNVNEPAPSIAGSPPTLLSVPDGYCPECGGGRWIRETHTSDWQCERCAPAEPHVEFLYVPGGTPHLAPPIEAGWLVAYRDRAGKLCGGADDRPHGTVEACEREAGRWTVVLTDGQRLPLASVRAVAATYPDGRIRGAWDTQRHGFDGNGNQ